MQELLQFPKENERFLLPGPAGQLEVMTTWPIAASTVKRVMIICHPHPLYHGTMDNKVVTVLAKVGNILGWPTVRFNFRGVGHSTGSYGDSIGEYEDLQAIVRWVDQELPDYRFCLAGFSFGSYISARFANQEPNKIDYLISIGPPAHHYDYLAFDQIRCPWFVIQGDQDEVVPFESVQQFVDKAIPKIEFMVIPQAKHFFHGKLLELQNILEQALIS